MSDIEKHDEESLTITGKDLKQMFMNAKEFGDAWLKGNEAESQRKYKIEQAGIDLQKKQLSQNGDQFIIDRVLLVIFVGIVITLSVLNKLSPEVMAFLMLLIGYFVKFQPMKKAFAKKEDS